MSLTNWFLILLDLRKWSSSVNLQNVSNVQRIRLVCLMLTRLILQMQLARLLNFAEEGDVVLLSPANASWDMYANFEVRGDLFIDTVAELKG